jgi:DNA-binding FadR family transcriptional regulator
MNLMNNYPAGQLVHARVSRAEAVARELERMIGDEFASGARIGTKTDLRDRFRVAVATMNEAIRLLEARGIVETRPGPGGGVFAGGAATRLAFSHLVLDLSSGGLAYTECLEIRDALEPAICAHAAHRHRATDIRALRQIVKRMSGDDAGRYFKANWELHRKIASLCQNVPMRSIYLAVLEFLEATVDEAQIEVFDFAGFHVVHSDLVEAIDSGDIKRVDRAVARHRPTQEMITAAGPKS